MTKEELEKEAKERAKDYTENKERQVAYECGFLDGADALEKEIKNKISEHKECCKKLVEEYRQRYNEDKTDKLSLNMFYHNVIAYNNFETVLSMIEDRNSVIMCFGEPPLLTEKTVEVELNHIADLEKENAELKNKNKNADSLNNKLEEDNYNLTCNLNATLDRLNEATELLKATQLMAQVEGLKVRYETVDDIEQFLKEIDE